MLGLIASKLILGAVLVGAVGIVAAFWKDLVDFLKKAIRKVEQLVDGILYDSKVFLRKLREGAKEISRHYSKVDGHWQETTVTKTVSESQVPPEILERARESEELDITEELEMQLESA